MPVPSESTPLVADPLSGHRSHQRNERAALRGGRMAPLGPDTRKAGPPELSGLPRYGEGLGFIQIV